MKTACCVSSLGSINVEGIASVVGDYVEQAPYRGTRAWREDGTGTARIYYSKSHEAWYLGPAPPHEPVVWALPHETPVPRSGPHSTPPEQGWYTYGGDIPTDILIDF